MYFFQFSNLKKCRAQVGKIEQPRCDLWSLPNAWDKIQHLFQRNQKVPQKLLFCQDYKVKVKTISYKLTTSMKVSNKWSQIGPTNYFACARCICCLKKSFCRKKGDKILWEKQADHDKTKDTKWSSTQCPVSPYKFGLISIF